jgi:hypothetical protein
MFNPFPAPVMEAFLGNLAASLDRRPRQLRLIYFFPVCHDEVIASGLFEEAKEVDVENTHPYAIYAHQATVTI